MLIRAATANDLLQIKALWNAMIRDTTATFMSVQKSDEDLAALFAVRRDAFLVAELGGICAGFITWGPFRAGDGYVHTAEHSIITQTHGKGIGRTLLKEAMSQAYVQGIHVMVAAIGGENTAAVTFHERLGFAKTGHLPQVGHKMGRWHDLILMSRTLTAP
ncbi:GNAT family N-acetyltransferase [uncultured Sulfitobacter sp.]|uniref:GNAT family N-acetyltransferase n=1 Tax=uncultured Sulfitobacter sp. TaxID=191468 RepID=UPI002620FA88|nr:GNAT family N-acetyltransferase [uncultured Sulfitobacter sp.]